MTKKHKASILAIGNEILIGQIINKNASSLSKSLLDYNIETTCHLAVRDIEKEIHQGLDYLKGFGDIVFISGGLGPTEDDLTRQALASYLKLPLDFDEDCFKDLEEKLHRRNVKVTENHRQQALFPKGAKRIHNSVGTADGFYLEHNQQHYFVVPGPPAEIKSCWQNFISDKLEKDLSNLETKEIFSMHILGLPESEVADRVSRLCQGMRYRPEYRLHLPYVELRFQHHGDLNTKDLENRFREEFGCHFYYTGENGVDKKLKEVLKGKKVLFVDSYSDGNLFEVLRAYNLHVDYYNKSMENNYTASGYDWLFEFQPGNSFEEPLQLSMNQKKMDVKRLSDRRLSARLEKRKMVELALWKVAECLAKSPH
tara:strand:+ start:340 stop:1446 length:1107 start_codon:yes stop_codon:yes gene_type:complete